MTVASAEVGFAGDRDVVLLDLVDRMLGKGVVIGGDLVISVADVDLVYVSLRALIASVETAIDRQLVDRNDLR